MTPDFNEDEYKALLMGYPPRPITSEEELASAEEHVWRLRENRVCGVLLRATWLLQVDPPARENEERRLRKTLPHTRENLLSGAHDCRSVD